MGLTETIRCGLDLKMFTHTHLYLAAHCWQFFTQEHKEGGMRKSGCVSHNHTQARVTLMRFACHVWCAFSKDSTKRRVIPSKCCIKPPQPHTQLLAYSSLVFARWVCGAYFFDAYACNRTEHPPIHSLIRCQRYDPDG